MAPLQHFLRTAYHGLLSEQAKHRGEQTIIRIAIASFLIHLGLIFLEQYDLLGINDPSKLLTNPIAAIYTPFSFILVYEVYLLIYYLPRSITTYIGKQYEIITLIVIRRIFKDLANLDLTTDWFNDPADLQFTFDILATVLLFGLILLFYWANRKQAGKRSPGEPSPRVQGFIRQKKLMALCLVPIMLALAGYSFVNWFYEHYLSVETVVGAIRDVNDIFFDQFFTILILTDVLLLLLSLLLNDTFHKVIRNSGFVISTILIRISFGTEGVINNALIVGAVLFGLMILVLHNVYEYERFHGAAQTPSS